MAAGTTPLNGPRRAGRTGFPMGLCKAAGPCGERGTEPSGLFAARRKEGGSVSFSEVRSDGLFPRYQGKACVRTPPSGRFFTANLGGTAEVSRLLSQKYLLWVLSWDGGLFLTPPRKRPEHGRSGCHGLSILNKNSLVFSPSAIALSSGSW